MLITIHLGVICVRDTHNTAGAQSLPGGHIMLSGVSQAKTWIFSLLLNRLEVGPLLQCAAHMFLYLLCLYHCSNYIKIGIYLFTTITLWTTAGDAWSNLNGRTLTNDYNAQSYPISMCKKQNENSTRSLFN